MEPGLRVIGSPGQQFWPGRVGSRVSVSDPMFDPVLSFNMRVYCFCRVTPSRQTNIRGFGFGSVPVTALLFYLFRLVSVKFTYLHAVCTCDVTTFLDLTSFRLLTESGHRVKSHRVGRIPGQKSWPGSISDLLCMPMSYLDRLVWEPSSPNVCW